MRGHASVITLAFFAAFADSEPQSRAHAESRHQSQFGLDPIVVGGNMLFNAASRERFYVKGITYGYDVDDSAEQYWMPAVEKMAALGVNTIRIYRVKPSVPSEPTSYDKFMTELAKRGMYAVIAISPDGSAWNGHSGSPPTGCTLERNNLPDGPAIDTCYPPCLLTYGKMVISQFAKYSNVLTYIVANEVMNEWKTFEAAPCVKAYARDIKKYMRGCGNSTRQVPLMYAAADNGWAAPHTIEVNKLDFLKAQYLTCGDDVNDGTIDIMGYNVYRWCDRDPCERQDNPCDGPLYNALKPLGIPVLFAEYGCAQNTFDPLTGDQRDWSEVAALYGDMADVYSGGFAYAYGEVGVNAFAFYNSDGKAKAIDSSKNKNPSGSPGYTKICSPRKSDGNITCGADNFEQQLKTVKAPAISAVGDDVCHLTGPGYKPPGRIECPDLKQYGLNVTKDRIPSSREGLDKQDKTVSCADRSLSEQEQALEACQAIPTATPTKAPPVTVAPTNSTPSTAAPTNATTPPPAANHTPAPSSNSPSANHTAAPSNHTPAGPTVSPTATPTSAPGTSKFWSSGAGTVVICIISMGAAAAVFFGFLAVQRKVGGDARTEPLLSS